MVSGRLHCDICAVRDSAPCSALDDSERLELSRLGHHRGLKRGETLFAAGDRSEVAATLTRGVLKVSSFDEGGAEHIVSLIHPAGFAGELFEARTHLDIIALTDCELCIFSRAEYERAIQRFPDLGRALLQRASRELTETRTLLAAVTGRSATQKVAGLLLAIGRSANQAECHPAIEFDLVLTRGEIAALLGLTIETVSRQLTGLEKDGVIRRKGARGVLVLNAPQLETLAA